MMRGDETAAAKIPTQPSTSDGPDDADADDADDLAEPTAPAETAAPAVAAPVQEPGLDERSKEILAFERKWWRQAGSKEQAIRDTFELSATRYYQLLNALLDDPVALAHEPVVVQRLRRLRASRIRSRGSSRRQ